MQIHFDTSRLDSYMKFLKVRQLPIYRFKGNAAIVPKEYESKFNGGSISSVDNYSAPGFMFDYQRDITEMAIRKRKYAVFADCGLGKTLILLEFARKAVEETGKKVLIVSPLMVINQTIKEHHRWFHDEFTISRVRSSELGKWMESESDQIGITNYEAITDAIPRGDLGGLVLDESSMLKSHYGKWGTRLIEIGRGVEWKLCCTGTPAPNDRIEFANHAVLLDRCKTVNEFLAAYFVNRGQTQNRWEIKPHALKPFYRCLADWSIFLNDPGVYGWKDNVHSLPPVNIHIEDVPLTAEQRAAAQKLTGNLVTASIGGIATRGKLSQIAKGYNGIPTNKPEFIKDMIGSWSENESTIVWCHYNQEQDSLAKILPDSVSVSGSTSEAARQTAIDDFVAAATRTLITKPKILGFGLNLQVATRQVFSGIKDSYEEFYQAVKRSNRIGSKLPLNVHIPVTELEMPFVENVLRKADRVESDTKEQEQLFKEIGNGF